MKAPTTIKADASALAILLDNVSDALCVIDFEGNIDYFNLSANTLFNKLSASELNQQDSQAQTNLATLYPQIDLVQLLSSEKYNCEINEYSLSIAVSKVEVATEEKILLFWFDDTSNKKTES